MTDTIDVREHVAGPDEIAAARVMRAVALANGESVAPWIEHLASEDLGEALRRTDDTDHEIDLPPKTIDLHPKTEEVEILDLRPARARVIEIGLPGDLVETPLDEATDDEIEFDQPPKANLTNFNNFTDKIEKYDKFTHHGKIGLTHTQRTPPGATGSVRDA